MSVIGDNAAGSWIGIALSRGEIVAYDSRLRSTGSSLWRMPLDVPAADQLSWPSLATALRTLKQLARENHAHLAIALMPSLAETRRVDVPPLSDDETEAVLSRNAQKFFVAAQGAQIVAVDSNRIRGSASTGTVAASAPAWIIRQISLAARESGWKLEHIAPAEAAWSSGSAKMAGAATADALVLVHQPDHTHALMLSKAGLTTVRRFRSVIADVPIFQEMNSSNARIVAVGDPAVRKQWMGALAERGASVALPSTLPADVANDAAAFAAAFIVDVDTLIFRTEEMRAADRKRRNRVMYSIASAAAALFVASGVFLWWDVSRELEAVQAERLALKPQLRTTLLGRSSVETVSNQLQTLATNERESAHWSVILADITQHLPDEAHLTAFRGWADSVRFEGLAERAASIFAPLEKAESISGMKAAAAVRLEPQVDGSSLEKFTLIGKVRPQKAASAMSSDSAKRVGAAPASKEAN
ncbi:MAG: hypothetical protein ACO1Q7_18915 [Gemmatimonas sp.]